MKVTGIDCNRAVWDAIDQRSPNRKRQAGPALRRGNSMSADIRQLIELNTGIGDAENRGARDWLAARLAPKLAFQRADPARTVDDRETFLSKVTKGGDRTTEVNAIDVRGDIAVVRCTVRADGKDFENARLFVRRNNEWKLLAWANEPAATRSPNNQTTNEEA